VSPSHVYYIIPNCRGIGANVNVVKDTFKNLAFSSDKGIQIKRSLT
jgi:hypothetical protein